MSFRRLALRSTIALFTFGAAANEMAFAAPIASDTFTYPNGNLVDQGGWAQTGTTTTTPVQVVNNAVPLTTGQDVNLDFAGSFNSGSLYFGLDVNITAAATAGDYFAHFIEQSSSSNFGGRFFARSATGGFQFGIAIGNAGTIYGTTTLPFGAYRTTVRYDFVTGAGNDIATVYVNPTSATESSNTVYATVTGGGTDLANAGNFGLRQGGSSTFPTVTVDNLNIADDFASAANISSGGGPVVIGAVAANNGAFGNLLLGATATTSVTLTNSGGTATSDITGNAVTGFTIGAPASQIVASGGGTTTSTVSVDTSTPGDVSGNLTYTANPGAVTSTPTIALSANVGTTTYGVPITADTPNAPTPYTTPTGGLTGSVTGVAADGTPVALNSTVQLLFYTNSTAGDSGAVNITMRTRTADEASSAETLEGGGLNNGGIAVGYLISDVANVTGMIDSGTQTDRFVLQMSYDPTLLNGFEEAGAALQRIFLATKTGGNWVNAVTLNQGAGNMPTFKLGAYALGDETTLGMWGVDTDNNVAWAVVNHNSEFAVIPEPSTLVFGGIAMLGCAGLGLRRRRQQSA